MTQQFTLDESRLAELAGRYPVETDHDALLAIEAALPEINEDPLITGPCEIAIELLADNDGEIDGWRVIISPDRAPDGPWIGGPIERAHYRETLDEPTEDGGIYDTAEIIRDTVTRANELLAWYERRP